MNRIASHVLTSAEKTAASPSAPSHGDRSLREDGRQHQALGLAISGCSTRRGHAEEHRDEREEQQKRRLRADADPHRPLVPRAVGLLQQARRQHERPGRKPRAASTRTRVRRCVWKGSRKPSGRPAHRGNAAEASDGRVDRRNREQEPDHQHDELDDIDPGRTQQPAGDEIDRHHDRADRRAGAARHAGDDFEDRGARDQLPGEDEQRADPDQRRRRSRGPTAVAELEKVAGGVEPVRLRERARSAARPRRRARARRSRPSRSTTTR